MTGHVLDVSTTGLRLETLNPLSPGKVLWVSLPGLTSQAVQVKWVRDRVAGCHFAVPLHPAVLKRLLETL